MIQAINIVAYGDLRRAINISNKNLFYHFRVNANCILRSYLNWYCLLKNIISKCRNIELSCCCIQTHYWRTRNLILCTWIIEAIWKNTAWWEWCCNRKLRNHEYLEWSRQRSHVTSKIALCAVRRCTSYHCWLLKVNRKILSLRTLYYWCSWFIIAINFDYKTSSKRAIWAWSLK